MAALACGELGHATRTVCDRLESLSHSESTLGA